MVNELPDDVKQQLEQLLNNTGQKGGKKRSKKASKKSSKKGSKQKGGKRELPLAIRARIDLAKFITSDLKVKGGVIIQRLIKLYADKIKEKNPNIDAVSLVAEAKKAYLADKPNGPHEKLKKLSSKEPARSHSKKSSKKASVGGAKRRTKKSSKK